MSWSRRLLRTILGGLAVAGALACLAPGTAGAWWNRAGWRGGVYVGLAPAPLLFGPPVIYAPPPVFYPAPPPPYYPPPVATYPPPPAWYLPPATYAAPAPALGQTCFAGPYVCSLLTPMPSGSTCSCAASDRVRAYGTAR